MRARKESRQSERVNNENQKKQVDATAAPVDHTDKPGLLSCGAKDMSDMETSLM